MAKKEAFIEQISKGYQPKADFITLGAGVFEGNVYKEVVVKAPLSTINRHGLIAGATGTGKTKTLQRFAESLSDKGCPVLLMDIKGDVSGISQEGAMNDRIKERHEKLGIQWNAAKYPVEFLTISEEKGTRMRATVSEFGPVLFSKILELNDTQSSVVSLVFKYADDNSLPLLDLEDFKKTLQYLVNEGKEEAQAKYGAISESSVGTIMRKVIDLEAQDAAVLFGERSFEVEDLIRKDANGKGMINVLRLTDMQTKPKLFSTFMMCLLAEVYEKFPEEGDVEKPKLTIFIDEAHLIFETASSALLAQIETIIKLIRSKGVGIYFITQNPVDVPPAILGQLGLKVQHALRAFTANDRKAIKLASENFPITEFYEIDEVLTTLGMGEAFVTVLDEKGNPTPLVHTMLCAPQSRMDTITPDELGSVVSGSSIANKYNEVINRDSALEILNKKIADHNQAIQESQPQVQHSDRNQSEGNSHSKKEDPGFVEGLTKNTMVRQVGRAVASEVTRGILGIFGLGGRRR
jgi:uncharacterized protein